MNSLISISPTVQDLSVGIVEAHGVTIQPPSAEQVQQCRDVVQRAASQGPEGGDPRRQAVRQLLRHGGFKPSGRNKPAQEYLLRAAGTESQWPTIFNAVDALNVVSLQSGLPISLVAINRLNLPLSIRYGASEESFVFNQAGQILKLRGLICICQDAQSGTEPVGTPVKDSLLAKVTPDDTHMMACIFAPSSAVPADRLQYWTDELASQIRRWCNPTEIRTMMLGGE